MKAEEVVQAMKTAAPRKPTRQELKTMLYESSPSHVFQRLLNDMKAIRATQARLGHIRSLDVACAEEIDKIRRELHDLIEQM